MPPWDRFIEPTRRVLLFAQEEATRLEDPSVGTEHLLLGLLREKDCVAARVLGRLGTPLWRVRYHLRHRVPRGAGITGDMELTPQVFRALALADEEARLLGHEYIGPQHLLLGVLREENSLAARVLTKLGASLERARSAVAELPTGR